MKRKLIIDTDPGIDDAYAIFAALRSTDVEILGITCVSGNKGLDVVVLNALKLTQFLKMEVPVFKGAATNLENIRNGRTGSIEAGTFHGADGLGNVDLPCNERNLSTRFAVDFILETIRKHPHEIEILALGPLTNLALAIEKEPDTMLKVKRIYTMGGGIHRGNVTEYAEYNYYFDALAANLVFQTLQEDVDIVMIGLDATHSTRIDHNDLAFMKYEGGDLGELIYRISQLYFEQYYRHSGYLGGVIHDLIAFLCLVEPGVALKVKENVHIDVLCDEIHKGQTVIRQNKKAKTKIVLTCDNYLCNELFIKILFPDQLNRYLWVKAR